MRKNLNDLLLVLLLLFSVLYAMAAFGQNSSEELGRMIDSHRKKWNQNLYWKLDELRDAKPQTLKEKIAIKQRIERIYKQFLDYNSPVTCFALKPGYYNQSMAWFDYEKNNLFNTSNQLRTWHFSNGNELHGVIGYVEKDFVMFIKDDDTPQKVMMRLIPKEEIRFLQHHIKMRDKVGPKPHVDPAESGWYHIGLPNKHGN